MFNWIKKVFIEFKANKNRKEYERLIKQSKINAALMHLLITDKQLIWESIKKHPYHDQRFNSFKLSLKHSKVESLNFGDSLTDLAYKYFTEIDGKFAISASWHKHMYDMMIDVSAELSFYKRKKEVKYVFIGTLGGNPLLVYQDFNRTVEYSIKTLNKARELFPEAKIIVYGLPPVYNIHATLNTLNFDEKMLEWVKSDKNSTFIFLKDKMGGFFPKAKWSNDGVHLNPRGAKLLNNLFKKAKNKEIKIL